MKTRITALLALALGAVSCISTSDELGMDLLPLGQSHRFYTVSLPLEEIDVRMTDKLSGYSSTRITVGSVMDSEYGLTTRKSAITLVPMFVESLDFGKNPEFKSFHFAVKKDTLSSNNEDQRRILQNIRAYELSEALDAEKDYDCNKALAHKEGNIIRGFNLYNGSDSLSFDFTEEFGKKYLQITQEDLEDFDKFQAKFPGILLESEDPAADGGRINLFELQLGYNSDYGYIEGNCAKLRFSAEYDGERKDTSFFFYFGANKFHDIDSLLAKGTRGKYPQYALNLTSQQTEDRTGLATDRIGIEGGGGLKPVISAKKLKRMAEQAISEKIAQMGVEVDPRQVVVTKASLIFPFEFPEDYLDMNYWPQILSPTCRISSDDGIVSYMGLTDSSSSSENQGDVNRSLLQYAPDITYHMQELVRIDESDAENAKTKRLNEGAYDIWLLIMANETITTTTSGSSEMSDYYNYLAYQSYYNDMYGYGGGYSNYYSNYYSYAMMAAYASASSTSTSQQVMLDKDRFYRASLNGPAAADGRVPTLELTFAIPLE